MTDEITALEYYLRLQQMRFDNRFTYQINIYPGYQEDEILIPPMLLQPFVENAVLHGVAEGGHIQVVIEKGKVYCTA